MTKFARESKRVMQGRTVTMISALFLTGAANAATPYSPKPAWPTQTNAPAPHILSRFDVETVASGLDHPWALAFLPDGRMLVTERPGRMRTIATDGALSAPIGGLPAIKAFAGEGLHDVVLSPHFARDRTIYFTYFAPRANDVPYVLKDWVAWLSLPAGMHERQPYGYERVARGRLSDDGSKLTDVRVILSGGDRRLVFAPDGNLLVTAATPAGGGIPVDMEPQDVGNSYGKVLRIRPDGSIPRDNPVIGKKGALPSLYAYGLRDVSGAAIDAKGRLWTSEMGPQGGDEVNLIHPGRNYGFPLISYGREYSDKLINGGKTAAPGLEQPVYFWTPSATPAGMTFYNGDRFPAWRGSLFVATLTGKHLSRLTLRNDRVVSDEVLLADRGKRIRTVYQGPDGYLYVLTDEKDGEIWRLKPR